tara:strand:- start:1715 stop:2302 length:588 start_codon:yes stop_codon:yes gene_type:complete
VKFINSIKYSFQNAFSLDGRANRYELWVFFLFCFSLAFIGVLLDVILFGEEEFGPFYVIALVLTIIPSICLQVRRIHDIGFHGAAWFLLFIPFVNIVAFFMFNLKQGDKSNNKFGPPPVDLYKSNSIALEKSIGKMSSKVGKNVTQIYKDLKGKKLNPEDIENELKKVEEMFKRNVISKNEREDLRKKILGILKK